MKRLPWLTSIAISCLACFILNCHKDRRSGPATSTDSLPSTSASGGSAAEPSKLPAFQPKASY